MRPNFALDLSHDGINLLHRGRKGWLRVGEVALDDPDMTGALRMLRRTATDLAQGRMSTKLLIPSSQVLYTTLQAPGPDRAAQIRKALEGRTPYAVDDLIFDFADTATAGEVAVAVVARSTLKEAEDFATEHRMNPVSFATRPEQDDFPGEPFFGQTQHAAEFLAGDNVERDIEPVVILGQWPATVDPSAENTSVVAAEALTDGVPPIDIAGDEPSEKIGPSYAPSDGAVPAAKVPSANTSPETQSRAPAAPSSGAKSDPQSKSKSGANTGSHSTARPAYPAKPPPTAPTAQRIPPIAASLKPTSPNPALPNPASPNSTPPTPASPGPASPKSTPAKSTDSEAFSFRTRREPGSSDIATTAGLDGFSPRILRLTPQDRGSSPAPWPVPRAPDPETPRDADAAVTSGSFPATSRLAADGRIAPLPDLPSEAPAPDRPAPPARTAAPRALGSASRDADLDRPQAPNMLAGFMARSANLKPGRVLGPAQPDPEVEAMTVFGARQSQKPRRHRSGMMLTAALVLVLIGVAIWSSLYVGRAVVNLFGDPAAVITQRGPTELQNAGLGVTASTTTPAIVAQPATKQTTAEAPAAQLGPQPGPVTTRVATAPDPESQTAPNGEIVGRAERTEFDLAAVSPGSLPDPAQDALNRGAGAVDIAQTARAAAAPGTLPSRQDAERRYAATGIWLLPPRQVRAPAVRNETIENLYVASVDPVVLSQDAIALPQMPERGDRGPSDQQQPPAAGDAYDLDERGFVRATAEGAVTPEGAVVFAGRPPVSPVYRPVTEAPIQAGTDADTETASATATEPATTPAAETANAATAGSTATVSSASQAKNRPIYRPSDLSGQTGPSDLAGLSTKSEQTGVRPRGRPEDIARNVQAAEQTEEEAEDDEPAGLDTATRQAVSESVVPSDRPANLQEAFARLQKASRSKPDPTPATSNQRTASRSTSIPTTASVAKQATERNALPLGKVSLIGVYGSPSKRRALVRLPSGRFVKVEVGDKLDGARVSGIGADSLRLQKGSRDMVLRMPKS